MHRRSRLGVKVGNEEDHLEDNVDDVEDDERLLALPLRVPLIGRLEMLVFELICQIEQENSFVARTPVVQSEAVEGGGHLVVVGVVVVVVVNNNSSSSTLY